MGECAAAHLPQCLPGLPDNVVKGGHEVEHACCAHLPCQDLGVAEPPRWLTRAFSLLERDDLSVDLRQLHTLQKVGFPQGLE